MQQRQPLLLEAFHAFWERNPALLYGLAMFLGICSYHFPEWVLIIPALILWLFLPFAYYFNYKILCIRLLLAGVITGTAFIYAKAHCPTIELPLQGVHGKAALSIHSVQKRKTIMGIKWVAEARIDSFLTDSGTELPPVEAGLLFPADQNSFIPSFDQKWTVEGILKNSRQTGKYVFKTKADARWTPLGYNWRGSLAVWREKIKSSVRIYLDSIMESSHSAPFLAGLFTGQFDDSVLSHHFGRFGIQHILAISGFHFALLAAVLGFLLSLFFSKKIAVGILGVLLTFYFVILGSSASILRAWISCILGIIAYLCCRRSAGLNILGISLGIVCILDPYCYTQPGFQYSFAITAAILLFCGPFEELLNKILPKRDLSIAVNWDFTMQHIYIIGCAIRSVLALTLAVNVAAIPLILYHSQGFPLFSLLYNLFFPFLVSISMLLIILGTIGETIFSALGQAIHTFNGYFTYGVIGLALDAPPALDIVLRVPELNAAVPIICLTFLFILGIALKQRNDESKICHIPEQ